MVPDSGLTLSAGESSINIDDDAVPSTAPEPFRHAVETLLRVPLRREAVLERIRPPQRLAPWSFAVAVDLDGPAEENSSTGRLVVLYDPEGTEAWDGELRLVAYAQADLSSDMANDPLLPEVGWSWLLEALQLRAAAHTAVGGTVTHTTSTRFGDLHGPRSTTQLELRGSWTATETDLTSHLLAFVDLLSLAAGLPPEGVVVLGDR
ncbi:DUF3000 domain-containing protein [Jatrophihabitans telluris]|uniref:DUF3000 domain-containing protein n=1 Tax=Jatrophihabitans telluris TaxID=2038343 RepID=A0ABY4QS58_9ACTN|nr:DUF3000 domain-containing protein [Jatrophihabitans telluris]UQX86689.1 DUF3000 domain-containing protein [Jatrophihabitans telluris]